jgi:L-alanine-DL-glutamate epimerase-like enolase superfamily enzyme
MSDLHIDTLNATNALKIEKSKRSTGVDIPWWEDLVTGIEKPIVKNGFVKVPETPGLGVDLNEPVIRGHLVKDTGYFDPTPDWNQERANDRLWS